MLRNPLPEVATAYQAEGAGVAFVASAHIIARRLRQQENEDDEHY